jgi:Tol biopolymer transport system component
MRLASGPLWDLTLSPTENAIAFTKEGSRRGDRHVWLLALDPATGLASGVERLVSPLQGDVPSLSPDGNFLAFARDDPNGVGQSVVVVPAGGGAERVVAPALPSSVASIRWTPDGGTLYFGVNPPVACVPEWSCLPLAPELRLPPGSIRRVAASGGEVTMVTAARGLTPGLSPDGTTLMFLDTARTWVVMSADGARRDIVTLAPGRTPAGWLRDSTVLISSGGSVRRLRTMSLADGQSQVLVDGADLLETPSWSPDGTLLLTVARGPRTELRILTADGSPQRTIPLPENHATSAVWSPDQRWIAYTGFSEKPPPHVAVVEVATGRSRPLHDLGDQQVVALRWLADSRSFVLAETFNQPENSRRVVFRTMDLSGRTSVLREFPLGPPPNNGLPIDETRAVVMQDAVSGYRLVRLHGGDGEREIMLSRPGDTPAVMSQDGQWLTLRRVASSTEGAPAYVLELARLDGTSRSTVHVPFVPMGFNPSVVPGGRGIIVLEAGRQDVDPGVYLVSPDTEAVRKLFTYSTQYGPPEVVVSPDGRRLLYLVWESVPRLVMTIDLAAARR